MENPSNTPSNNVPQKQSLVFAAVKGVLIGSAIGGSTALFCDVTSNNSIKWNQIIKGEFSGYNGSISKKIYPILAVGGAALNAYWEVRDTIKNNREAKKIYSFVAREEERRANSTGATERS
jgi:hypothetical protein